jgi:hypothetical protein
MDFGDICFRASQPDQPSIDQESYVPIKIPHHATFADLKAAAEKGCELCIELLKDGAGGCWGHPSQYGSPKSAIYCSAVGIEYHKSSKPYLKQAYRGVSILSFASEPFPFWSRIRVFCEHGKQTYFSSFIRLFSDF